MSLEFFGTFFFKKKSTDNNFFLYFLLDQKVAKSQVGRNPTAQPRPHRLPTLLPASVILKIPFKF